VDPSSTLAQALVAPIFVAVMVIVLMAGLALSALLDPTLWIPKPSGLGWTVDFANPHAKYLGILGGTWAIVLVFGLSSSDAPGISILTHGIAQLILGASSSL